MPSESMPFAKVTTTGERARKQCVVSSGLFNLFASTVVERSHLRCHTKNVNDEEKEKEETERAAGNTVGCALFIITGGTTAGARRKNPFALEAHSPETCRRHR